MGNLLTGLEDLGLSDLSKMDVFQELKETGPDKKAIVNVSDDKRHTKTEEEYLFLKSYVCPVCEYELKVRTVRAGKVKLIGTDLDLRPRYNGLDPLKYDTILCPRCGYAAITRFFSTITYPQSKLILEKISPKFNAPKETEEVYTYDDAILRHRIALVSAMVKKSKISERAYICLKTAWLLRGKREELQQREAAQEELESLFSEENEFLKTAYEGFQEALSKESLPICGMDEMTILLLLSELARRTAHFDDSARLLSKILVSRTASDRIKNKAREIKELVMDKKVGEE